MTKQKIDLSVNLMLESLSRDEVRKLATVLGVPRGKDKGQTVINIAKAVFDDKVGFKCEVQFNLPLSEHQIHRMPLFNKKFHSYKDKVIVPMRELKYGNDPVKGNHLSASDMAAVLNSGDPDETEI